jgi:hypothetical protein
MRSHSVRSLAVSLLLVVALGLPAAAAPRGDEGPPLMQRVVQAIRHVFHFVTISSDELSVPRP